MEETGVFLDNVTLHEVISDVIKGAEVVTAEAEQAVAPGEHYLSTLLRVNATFRRPQSDKENEIKLIIKAHPQGILSEFVQESEMFTKELIAYNKILSRINKENGSNITPERLGSIRDDLLVLEDLKVKGFQTTNRVEKLDFQHAREALKTLADFQAASIKVYKQSPSLFDELKVESIYTDKNMFMRQFVATNFKLVGDEFEKVPHLRKYSDKLRRVSEQTWNAVKEAFIPRKDRVNVFCHGDFWTTNILYSYDNQHNITDTRLVDYQFCRWGSPAFDLQMLFITSLRDLSDIPKLTNIYLEHFNSHFPTNVLTEDELESEMRRMDCFGFLTAVCTLPICILDPKTPLDFGGTTIDDFNNEFPEDRPNPYVTALRDKGYQRVIPEYLDYYQRSGFF